MSRFSSRKFLLSVGSLLVSGLLVFLDSITPEVFQAVVQTTVGAYMVGNVGHRWVSAGEKNT